MAIITSDNSPTLFNEEYQEYYHSKSGAVEEAFEKFVKPCRIKELSKAGHIRILDIGFGLGYNAIAAIEEALNQDCEIEIISLEKDAAILSKLKSLKPNLKYYWIASKLEHDQKNNTYNYEDRNIYLKINIGDATKLVKNLKGRFDAVFLDPFSPKKNPELWTEEFFSDIRRLMKPETILATYSYAKSVRLNLEKAGSKVMDGPIIGRRSPSTIAKIL